MSPVLLVFLLFGTLSACPHMYTVPCPLTQAFSPPPPNSPSSGSYPQNYNAYPMKLIVSYPQSNAGHPSCDSPPEGISHRGDLGTVSSILKLPGVLADKLISGEISLK